MDLPSYFDEFRIKTQPTDRQREVMIREHRLLRDRLLDAPELKEFLLGTFIQGSQRRSTSLIGSKDHPCDVDVVAVTNLPRSKFTAAYAHQLFRPVLERHYSGRYSAQDRSWCITVDSEVTMDLVPTSEPDSPEIREAIRGSKALKDWTPSFQTIAEAVAAEASDTADWDRTSPLWIPDRTLKIWERTHPLFLIAWTARKNKACNGHFTHVVKAIKWWKREIETLPKYPKGYPLEHLVADCCPDGITSVAEGVTKTLETIVAKFQAEALVQKTPFLQSRGIAEPLNVMSRVDGKDFAAFHAKIQTAASLARSALDSKDAQDSASKWRKLLGDLFPQPEPEVVVTGGFTPRDRNTRLSEGRYG